MVRAGICHAIAARKSAAKSVSMVQQQKIKATTLQGEGGGVRQERARGGGSFLSGGTFFFVSLKAILLLDDPSASQNDPLAEREYPVRPYTVESLPPQPCSRLVRSCHGYFVCWFACPTLKAKPAHGHGWIGRDAPPSLIAFECIATMHRRRRRATSAPLLSDPARPRSLWASHQRR